MKRGLLLLRQLMQWVLATGAGITALLALVWIGVKLKDAYDYHLGFQQERWLTAGEPLYANREGGLDNPREAMVADVLAHYLPPGMTRAQVLALLGPADSFEGTVRFPAYLASQTKLPSLASRRAWCVRNSQTAPWLSYGVGWGLLDPTCLAIRLDSTDRVAEYNVHEQ